MKKTILYTCATLIAAGSVFGAFAYNLDQMAKAPSLPRPPQVAQAPEVDVVNALAASYQASVTGYGEAMARYQLQLSAEVSGRVDSLNKSFATGRTLAKGAELAQLDSTAYRQALASAQADLADARRALLEEQRQGEQARQEWQASGLKGEPDSPLVLRAPQLAAAQANYEMAKVEVEKAQRDLQKTRITTPFEALVVSREIQPGSYVQTGSQIATLYSTDSVEIEVPLSAADWQNLPDTATLTSQSWPVRLTDATGEQQWQGYVGRVEQHLQSSDRQRSLIVVVEQPLEQNPPLYPGSFVEAEIAGRELASLWQLPTSALSQDGEIWLVDENNTLQSYDVNTRYQDSRHVYVQPPVTGDAGQVLVRPLSSYIPGMRVQAKQADDEDVAQVVARPLNSDSSGMKAQTKQEG